jgi:hypothetical protein
MTRLDCELAVIDKPSLWTRMHRTDIARGRQSLGRQRGALSRKRTAVAVNKLISVQDQGEMAGLVSGGTASRPAMGAASKAALAGRHL